MASIIYINNGGVMAKRGRPRKNQQQSKEELALDEALFASFDFEEKNTPDIASSESKTESDVRDAERIAAAELAARSRERANEPDIEVRGTFTEEEFSALAEFESDAPYDAGGDPVSDSQETIPSSRIWEDIGEVSDSGNEAIKNILAAGSVTDDTKKRVNELTDDERREAFKTADSVLVRSIEALNDPSISIYDKYYIQKFITENQAGWASRSVRADWERAVRQIERQKSAIDRRQTLNDPASPLYRVNQKIQNAIRTLNAIDSTNTDKTKAFESVSRRELEVVDKITQTEWQSAVDSWKVVRERDKSIGVAKAIERALVAMTTGEVDDDGKPVLTEYSPIRERLINLAYLNSRGMGDGGYVKQLADLRKRWMEQAQEKTTLPSAPEYALPAPPKFNAPVNPLRTRDRADVKWITEGLTQKLEWIPKTPSSEEEAERWEKQDEKYQQDLAAHLEYVDQEMSEYEDKVSEYKKQYSESYEEYIQKLEEYNKNVRDRDEILKERVQSGHTISGEQGDGEELYDFIFEDPADAGRDITDSPVMQQIIDSESIYRGFTVGLSTTVDSTGKLREITREVNSKINEAIALSNDGKLHESANIIRDLPSALREASSKIQTEIDFSKDADRDGSLSRAIQQINIILDRVEAKNEENANPGEYLHILRRVIKVSGDGTDEYIPGPADKATGLSPIINADNRLRTITNDANAQINRAIQLANDGNTEEAADITKGLAPLLLDTADRIKEDLIEDSGSEKTKTVNGWIRAYQQLTQMADEIQSGLTEIQKVDAQKRFEEDVQIGEFQAQNPGSLKGSRAAREAEKKLAAQLQSTLDIETSPHGPSVESINENQFVSDVIKEKLQSLLESESISSTTSLSELRKHLTKRERDSINTAFDPNAELILAEQRKRAAKESDIEAQEELERIKQPDTKLVKVNDKWVELKTEIADEILEREREKLDMLPLEFYKTNPDGSFVLDEDGNRVPVTGYERDVDEFGRPRSVSSPVRKRTSKGKTPSGKKTQGGRLFRSPQAMMPSIDMGGSKPKRPNFVDRLLKKHRPPRIRR